MRKKVISYIFSILFTLFIVGGLSFDYSGNFNLVAENPWLIFFLSLILIFLLKTIISFIFIKFDNFKDTPYKILNKLFVYFDKYPIIFAVIFILFCWLIYIIAFYPAILSPDPSFQILQYFNIDNKYSDYVVLLDENVILTNHHPIIHTLLLGSLAKLGLIFGDINIGLFIYSIIQTLILAFTLAYSIKFMKKIGVSFKYRLGCLLIYALVPVFPFYAMSPVKDVIFGCLLIFYTISIWNFIKNKESITWHSVIKEIILLVLIVLFRNNGFHIIILSLPWLLFISKKCLKKIIVVLFAVIAFYIFYNNAILPYYKITNTSIRETLSIPFQQTARYVKYHKDELSVEEIEAIDKVLNYDTLEKRYKEEKADAVKNGFNKYSTSKDLIKYFEAWYTGLKKEPLTYLEATINNTYGYFYPLKSNWYIYYKYNDTLKNHGFDYHYNDLTNLRTFLSNIGQQFPHIPILGLIVNIGFSTWIIFLLIAYLFYRKKYKEIIYLIPALAVLLVCVASPVNTYFRYALPNIFGMPTIIAIFLSIIKEGEKNEK